MNFSSRGLARKLQPPDKLLIDETHQIQCVQNYTYLGVALDSELNFETTAREVIKKVNHKLYLLSFIRKDIPNFCAIVLYKTMILPYFTQISFSIAVQAKSKLKFNDYKIEDSEFV